MSVKLEQSQNVLFNDILRNATCMLILTEGWTFILAWMRLHLAALCSHLCDDITFLLGRVYKYPIWMQFQVSDIVFFFLNLDVININIKCVLGVSFSIIPETFPMVIRLGYAVCCLPLKRLLDYINPHRLLCRIGLPCVMWNQGKYQNFALPALEES